MMDSHKRTVPLGHIIQSGPGLKGNPVEVGSGPAAVIPTSSPRKIVQVGLDISGIHRAEKVIGKHIARIQPGVKVTAQ